MLTRFRTPERDLQTDAERIEDVRSGVRRALLSIEKERDGLTRRLENARTRSASLLGNENGIHFQREPADERLLAKAESQMTYAYARLGRLHSQQAMLAGMLGNLEEVVAEAAPSRPPSNGAFRPGSGTLGVTSFATTGRWICPAVGLAILLAIVYAMLSR